MKHNYYSVVHFENGQIVNISESSKSLENLLKNRGMHRESTTYVDVQKWIDGFSDGNDEFTTIILCHHTPISQKQKDTVRQGLKVMLPALHAISECTWRTAYENLPYYNFSV